MRLTILSVMIGAGLCTSTLIAQSSIRPGQSVRAFLQASPGFAAPPRSPVPGRAPHLPRTVYVIDGDSGQLVLVRARSGIIDPILRWGAFDQYGTWRGINGTFAVNGEYARLAVTLGRRGEHVLWVDGSGSGDFELDVIAVPPPQPVRLRVGATVSGALTAGDYPGVDGLEDHYVIVGSRGAVVTLRVDSAEFDTHISAGVWRARTFERRASDDDSGQGTHSQLVVQLDETGRADVVLRSFDGREEGTYTLRVHQGALEPVAEDEPAVGEAFDDRLWIGSYQGRIQADSEVEELLESPRAALPDEHRFYREYAYDGVAGERVRIFVWSDDFSPYLLVGRGWGGSFKPLQEGEFLPSEFEMPENGTYTLRVTSVGLRSKGRFVLLTVRPPG